MPWPKFLVLTVVGAALWVGVWTTADDVTGPHTGTIYPIITRYGTYELGAIAFVAAVLLVRLGARRLFLRGCHCDQ
jgi:membrane protein DedA with SNARE-associated domain